MLKIKKFMATGLSVLLLMGANQAIAENTYNVASLGDYTGPFASIYPPVEDARRRSFFRGWLGCCGMRWHTGPPTAR